VTIRRRVAVGLAIVLLGPVLAVASAADTPTSSSPASFSFAAAGDFGANANTSKVLTAMAGAQVDFGLALGDLSYGEISPESAWCDYVQSQVGGSFPFELIAGNHDADGSTQGQIANFAACLPHRLGPLTGVYGQQYYFDYPADSPLARFIMISPDLTFPGESTYRYDKGSAQTQWLSDAIDSARVAGVRWIVVGMHEVCLTAGEMNCQIGTDLLNLLVTKKVDLVLQGHEHGYERSKQLAIGAGCPTVPGGSFNPACVARDGASGIYPKGAGTVFLVDGTGGDPFTPVPGTSPTAADFEKVMDPHSGAAHGFTRYTVSATGISARFVGTGGNFSDSFTITGPTNDQPAADAFSAATPADTAVALTLGGGDYGLCDLNFTVLTPPSHGTLSALTEEPCASGTPNRDHAGVTYTAAGAFTGTDSFTYQIDDGNETSPPATVTVSVSDPPTTTTTTSSTTTTSTTTTSSSSTTTTTSTTTTAPTTPPTTTSPAKPGTRGDLPGHGGYWALDAAGHVYPFGDAPRLGDPGGTLGGAVAVHLEPTPTGSGYWVVDSTGGVHSFGDATDHGHLDPAGLAPGETVTSLSTTPTGRGYWIFTNRGRVFPFGDAAFLGDMTGTKLNGPVLGSVATPTGKGYYMVASDGGIFAFGDAAFAGSMGGRKLNAPVQSLVPDADGSGYWLVASDGGIFAFDAPFHGSMGATRLNKPITGMIRYSDGYLMVGGDGGIFNFSTAPFSGSLGGKPPASPVVAVAAHL
jgi:hypothetical protein